MWIVEDIMKELKDKGWQGQLEDQIKRVQRYEENASSYSQICLELLNAHKLLSPEAKDIWSYEKAEAIYYQIVDTCRVVNS